MKEKKVNDSSMTTSQLMTQLDANLAGNVHGGVIMKLIDSTAGMAAIRHTSSNVVTASIDRLDFHKPCYVGELLTLKSSINFIGKKSMEIGVRAESENLLTGEKRHIATAYLTFVSLDQNGKPQEIPPITLETDEEKRRNQDAQERRFIRIYERNESRAAKLLREKKLMSMKTV